MKKLLITVIIVLSVTCQVVSAEITIKGDARVRPRLDQKFNEDGKTFESFYYMYWARLWINANLSEGWYFSTKLAADGPSNFIGVFGGNQYDNSNGWTDEKAAHSGSRGVLRFAEMHFGRKTDKYGFSMGILPMSGLGNPEYDLHFYPISSSDIPYTILNTATAAGFRGYYSTGKNKFNFTVTVDNETGNRETDDIPRDQYSIFTNYEMGIAKVKIAPTLTYTTAGEGLASPITLGINTKLPQIRGFGLSAGAYYLTQGIEDYEKYLSSLKSITHMDTLGISGKYSGIMLHGKVVKPIGPGTFVCWADYKTIDFDELDSIVETTLIWIMYKYEIYKSDFGSFYIAPTFRRMFQKYDDFEFARNKLELTLHMNFK